MGEKADKKSSNIEIGKKLLRESERYISWGSWELDMETEQFSCSPQIYEILGWPPERPFDREELQNLIHPEERDKKVTEMQQAIEKEGGFEIEMRLKREDGTVRHIRSRAHIIEDPDDKTPRLTGIIQDITDRKEVEQQLEEREQRFRSLFKHNPHPVYYFDLDGNFRGMNDKLVEFAGYSREKLLGMNFESFIAEDDLEETKNNFRKAAAGIPNEYEIKVIVKDEEGNDVEKEIRVTNFPMYVDDEVAGVFGILQDTTEQKRAKRALQRSEQQFKSLFEHNPNAVYSLDLEGNILMGNRALEKLTGYSMEELKEVSFEPLTAPDERENVWKKFEAAANGEPQNYETAGIHKNGHRFEIQITNLPIYIDGKIEGVFGIARDITEEKRAQERLKESEERWQQLVMNNPQPVQIVQDDHIIFINQAGAELFGASRPDELIGKSIIDFSHPDSIEEIKKRKQKLEEGEFIKASEHKIVSLDGSESYVQAHSIPIKYKGKPAIQTVLHDVTDQKKKEQVIKESLDEKEMLLKEIHHRVKNNLAVISGLLELQLMSTDDKSIITTLRDSQLRIQSIAMVHEKLYQSEALADIGFDVYLKELVQTISSTYSSAKRTIDIFYDLDSISLDLDQAIPCSLIVNEVVVNCYKHAFNGLRKGKIKIISEFNDPELAIKIKDNGKGIAEDFDVAEHQSLGMTLVQTLSDQLNGEIEFSPLTGQESGTVFKLKFDTV